MLYVLSQISVVLSCLIYGASFFVRKKHLLLLCNIANNFFFGLQYLLLFQLSSALSIFLAIAFFIITYYLEKHNKSKFTPLVSIMGVLLLIVISVLFWNGPLSLLPTIATSLVFIGTIFAQTLEIKLFYLVSTFLNVSFMFIIHSYFGVACNIVIIITAIIGIIKEISKRKKKV